MVHSKTSGFPGRYLSPVGASATVIACVIFTVGGCIFDPAIRGEMADLQTEILETIKDANDVTKQIERLAKVYQETREKFKAGTLASNAALALELLDKAKRELDTAKASYKKLHAHKKDLVVKITDLRKKHGVPNWQIALYIAGVIGSALGGGRYIQIGGRLGTALSAMRQLYGAIDTNVTGDERSAVKLQVSGANNPEIEKHHDALKALEAEDVDKKEA